MKITTQGLVDIRRLSLNEQEFEMASELLDLRTKYAEALKVIENLLSNAGLDWYCNKFARNPNSYETGISNYINNKDTEQRAIHAYSEARKFLAKHEGDKS